MAKQVVVSAKKQNDWKGFLNWRPSKEDKESIRGLVSKNTDYEKFLDSFAGRGYRCSFGRDLAADCYLLTIQATTEAGPDVGWAVSFRHNDFSVLVATALYFNENVCTMGDWHLFAGSSGGNDW